MPLRAKDYGADQRAVQTYTKQLLNWRKVNPVIATGKVRHFSPFDGIYVYFRYTTDKTVMVVMNKNEKSADVDMKRFVEMFQGKTVAKPILTRQAVKLTDTLLIPAKTAMVFAIE